MRRAAIAWLLAVLALAPGCATVREVVREVPERINQATKPVKYALAATHVRRRDSLERGLEQLRAGDHRAALRSLHRALWDLERIEKRWLRLEELAEAHLAIADAYAALKRPQWAVEHRALAAALADYPGRDEAAPPPHRALARAKSAYQAARFRDATVALGQALVELEGIGHTPARIASLEEARCYLALAHYALDQEERAREEIRRLAALDDSVVTCRREAPPVVQQLIRDVQLSEAAGTRRSIP